MFMDIIDIIHLHFSLYHSRYFGSVWQWHIVYILIYMYILSKILKNLGTPGMREFYITYLDAVFYIKIGSIEWLYLEYQTYAAVL